MEVFHHPLEKECFAEFLSKWVRCMGTRHSFSASLERNSYTFFLVVISMCWGRGFYVLICFEARVERRGEGCRAGAVWAAGLGRLEYLMRRWGAGELGLVWLRKTEFLTGY